MACAHDRTGVAARLTFFWLVCAPHIDAVTVVVVVPPIKVDVDVLGCGGQRWAGYASMAGFTYATPEETVAVVVAGATWLYDEHADTYFDPQLWLTCEQLRGVGFFAGLAAAAPIMASATKKKRMAVTIY